MDLAEAETLAAVAALGQEGTEMEVKLNLAPNVLYNSNAIFRWQGWRVWWIQMLQVQQV